MMNKEKLIEEIIWLGAFHAGEADDFIAINKANELFNAYEKQIKNIAYEPMLTPVLSEWDCDDCKFYPCNLRDKDNKLPYGTCGDHSERMVS